MALLKVANRSKEIGLQRVVNGTVVQRGPDYELPADRHNPKFSVSHGRGRITSRSRDARLHEITDDGGRASFAGPFRCFIQTFVWKSWRERWESPWVEEAAGTTWSANADLRSLSLPCQPHSWPESSP